MPRSEMTVMLCQIKEITLKARIFTVCLTLALLCFAFILALPGAVPAADGPEKTAGKANAKLLKAAGSGPMADMSLSCTKLKMTGPCRQHISIRGRSGFLKPFGSPMRDQLFCLSNCATSTIRAQNTACGMILLQIG